MLELQEAIRKLVEAAEHYERLVGAERAVAMTEEESAAFIVDVDALRARLNADGEKVPA